MKENNLKRMLKASHNEIDFKDIDLSKYNYIVKTSDMFMSGWGLASNHTAKTLLLCETKQQALTAIEKMDKCFKHKNWYNINHERISLNTSKDIYTLRVIDHSILWIW